MAAVAALVVAAVAALVVAAVAALVVAAVSGTGGGAVARARDQRRSPCCEARRLVK
ncbi:MAG: hypothetical protein ACTHMZ_14090 [Actinomycetes bacterium]